MTSVTQGHLLSDQLATVLAARYASLLQNWNGEVTEEFSQKLRTLRSLCQDVAVLRRGDHAAARLALDRERFEFQKTHAGEPRVRQPAKPPEPPKPPPRKLTDFEKSNRWRELGGMKLQTEEEFNAMVATQKSRFIALLKKVMVQVDEAKAIQKTTAQPGPDGKPGEPLPLSKIIVPRNAAQIDHDRFSTWISRTDEDRANTRAEGRGKVDDMVNKLGGVQAAIDFLQEDLDGPEWGFNAETLRAWLNQAWHADKY